MGGQPAGSRPGWQAGWIRRGKRNGGCRDHLLHRRTGAGGAAIVHRLNLWTQDDLGQTLVGLQGHFPRSPARAVRHWHQAMIVGGNADAACVLWWWHQTGDPRGGPVFCFKNHYPRSREHFLIPSAGRHTHASVDWRLMTSGDESDIYPGSADSAGRDQPRRLPSRPVNVSSEPVRFVGSCWQIAGNRLFSPTQW